MTRPHPIWRDGILSSVNAITRPFVFRDLHQQLTASGCGMVRAISRFQGG
jgi:hypothetical protein